MKIIVTISYCVTTLIIISNATYGWRIRLQVESASPHPREKKPTRKALGYAIAYWEGDREHEGSVALHEDSLADHLPSLGSWNEQLFVNKKNKKQHKKVLFYPLKGKWPVELYQNDNKKLPHKQVFSLNSKFSKSKMLAL